MVLTTLSDAAVAEALVRRLVEARLVACGTVLPGATSIYRWREGITTDAEVLVLLKTVRSRWDALAAEVIRHHPYEVPELLALPAAAGLDRYLDWLDTATSETTP